MLSETRHSTSERVRARRIAFAVFVGLVSACSSEALPPPEPEVYDAGAFFAVGDTELALYRTLKALRIEGDRILFTTLYDVVPASFEHAREIAKQPSIPIRQDLVSISEVLLEKHPLQVVWFRTLTKAEEDRSP